MEIRSLVKEDYEASVIMIAEFAEESLSAYGTYLDLDKLRTVFESGFLTSFGAFVDGKMVGLLGGRIVEDLCSKLPVYQEMIWFVTKEHRSHGRELLAHAMAWCRDQKITRMTMVCMHNSRMDTLFKLYERLGFKPVETHFVKEIE